MVAGECVPHVRSGNILGHKYEYKLSVNAG